DLSSNVIKNIESNAFGVLKQLQKLDISKNDITEIEPGAFQGLDNLQKLDLSNNKLVTINASMFLGLENLDKLSLAGNQFSTLTDGVFTHLTSLSKIDFGTEYLTCDCHLAWMLRWEKDTGVRVDRSTSCSFPRDLRATPFKTLKRKDLHCNWPVEIPLFELVPSTSQVVFEGDSLPLRCRVSGLVGEPTRVVWVRKGREVQPDDDDDDGDGGGAGAGLRLRTQNTHDGAIIVHDLQITK
ncbi:PREDICTED: adhesion G protein-coupled receptor A3-like, partial [Priapulus caudatus]|uniref:Adhesion G protein-coupled receptor A3-like n=1 Tax=Priapulus caudatus TaxID=37621 RepID=A0ABM1EPI1_PRICU